MAVRSAVITISSPPSATHSRQLSSSHRLPTVSASQALQDLHVQGPEALPSGLKSLDAALSATNGTNAGFERGKTTEVWGPSGAGKTTLLLETAAIALSRGDGVVWIDSALPLSVSRLKSAVDTQLLRTRISGRQDCMEELHHVAMPTLSHLLAATLHPRLSFPPEGTSLLVIDDLNALLDLDYPRFTFTSATKTEQQKWQAGRRYAVLGSLVTALNKMAVLNNLAVLVSTGCATRMRSNSGLGAALVPGIGGSEWDAGIWTRMVAFRDFGGRFLGLQRLQGRNLISREEVGEVGKLVAFDIWEEGRLCERQQEGAEAARLTLQRPGRSPVKPLKRTYDEVADSDGEDHYGWSDTDEDAITEGLGEDHITQAEDFP